MLLILPLLAARRSLFRSRAALELEILALRHQIGVLQRANRRPRLTPADRCLWVILFFRSIADRLFSALPELLVALTLISEATLDSFLDRAFGR